MRAPLCYLLFALTAAPLLQGAGCGTHYSARLQGQVETEAELRQAYEGNEARIVYRELAPGEASCADVGPSCLLKESWRTLEPCHAAAPQPANTTVVTVSSAPTPESFDACTAMIGVDYRADVAAFIDLDGDGEPSPGEPYGLHGGGPVTRGPGESRITIAIDATLPE